MTLQPILTHNLPRITQILKQNQVKRAYAFGSVCTERFGPDSDIDLLIAFDDGLDPIIYAKTTSPLPMRWKNSCNAPLI